MDIIIFLCFMILFFYHLIQNKSEILGFLLFFQEIIILFFEKYNLTNFIESTLICFYILYLLRKINNISLHLIKIKFSSLFFQIFLIFCISFLLQIIFKGYFSAETEIIFKRFFTQLIPIIILITLFVNNFFKLKNILDGVLIYGLIFFLILIFTSDFIELSKIARKDFREDVGISPIQLSRLSGFIFIISFFRILSINSLVNNILMIILLIISLSFLILGASRGPFIFLLISLSFSLYYILGFKKKLVKIFLFSICVYILAYFFFPMFSSFQFRFNEILDYNDMLRFKRIQFYSQNFFNFEIFLFGLGPAGFNYLTALSYPHNLFIELHLEYGFIGILLFFSLFFLILKSIYFAKNIIFDLNFITLLTCVIYFFLSSFVSGDIIGNRILFFLIFILFSYIFNLKYYRIK
jgi:hypothetical protein